MTEETKAKLENILDLMKFDLLNDRWQFFNSSVKALKEIKKSREKSRTYKVVPDWNTFPQQFVDKINDSDKPYYITNQTHKRKKIDSARLKFNAYIEVDVGSETIPVFYHVDQIGYYEYY